MVDANGIDPGHTGFMILCTALVQFMTPGLALFYGGIVGSTSVINVMFQSMVSLSVVFILWAIFGFSLTFGDPWFSLNGYHLLGDPRSFFMLEGVSVYGPLVRQGEVVTPGFPAMIFAAYQGMFAVITPALIAGSYVDRLRFGPNVLFLVAWLTLVYTPIGYWNWGGGVMYQLGARDFAGGIVVHESGGLSALPCVWILGRRAVPPGRASAFFKQAHNVPFVLLGTAVLWLGWFGFNAGSAMASSGLAGLALLNTQIAGASGMAMWVVIDWFVQGKPKLEEHVREPLPACVGYVLPTKAFIAGVAGAIVCYSAVNIIDRLDLTTLWTRSAFTVWAASSAQSLWVAFLDPEECADVKTAPAWCANPGTVTRSWRQVRIQLVCATLTAVYCCTATYLILKLMTIRGIVPILKHYEDQDSARDYEQFGEIAYAQHSVTPVPSTGTMASRLMCAEVADEESEDGDGSVSLDDYVKHDLITPRQGNSRCLGLMPM
eukprot:CAMPEP_0180566834 /NCGR_PEP_ID=MMETSP1037_2-20121125/6286_1 /TAXON_ID=632150 /ORGANISM="Azadinium spinosum, Strain 3D9" /LENGTH=489 /DNA_ID=CAMNT_0022583889 /DNA_START=10 /DNA_END=1479 /DNA_ORIENTATION=-